MPRSPALPVPGTQAGFQRARTGVTSGAIVFTIPKPDVVTGATRCINRMGLLRGDSVKLRFRRLNMECTRTKTEAAIAITRGKDE